MSEEWKELSGYKRYSHVIDVDTLVLIVVVVVSEATLAVVVLPGAVLIVAVVPEARLAVVVETEATCADNGARRDR